MSNSISPLFSFIKLGLTGISIGVQKQYSVGRQSPLYNLVTANGFSTFELRLQNAGNVDEANLFTGGTSVDGNNNVLGNLWAQSLKVIFDAKYGEFLGCHMIGMNVTEMIAEAVVARKLETTAHEILNAIHPHPTMSEGLKEATAAAYGEAIDI